MLHRLLRILIKYLPYQLSNYFCPVFQGVGMVGGGAMIGGGAMMGAPGAMMGAPVTGCQQVQQPVCSNAAVCQAPAQQCCQVTNQQVCRQVPQRVTEMVCFIFKIKGGYCPTYLRVFTE